MIFKQFCFTPAAFLLPGAPLGASPCSIWRFGPSLVIVYGPVVRKVLKIWRGIFNGPFFSFFPSGSVSVMKSGHCLRWDWSPKSDADLASSILGTNQPLSLKIGKVDESPLNRKEWMSFFQLNSLEKRERGESEIRNPILNWRGEGSLDVQAPNQQPLLIWTRGCCVWCREALRL